MRSLLLIATLLLSSAASAQVQLAFPNTTSTTDTLRFGKSRCADVVSVNWTRTLNPCSSLVLWVTSSTACSDAPGSGDYAVTEVPQATFAASTTGSFNVNIASLPFGTTEGSATCTTLTDERTFRLCGATTQRDTLGTCTSTVYKAAALKLTYDGKPPGAPTISAVSGLDKAVSATVTTVDDATEVRLEVVRGGEVVAQVRQASGKGSIRVDGLENDVTYQVRAYAYDQAGNESVASASVEVTPVKTQGFIALYEAGEGTTGCGAANGGVAGGAVLAALGFWLFSRRNRSWFEQ